MGTAAKTCAGVVVLACTGWWISSVFEEDEDSPENEGAAVTTQESELIDSPRELAGTHREPVEVAVTSREFLMSFWGDQWAEMKRPFEDAGVDLEGPISESGLQPWEEVEAEVKEKALSQYEQSRALTSKMLLGMGGPTTAEELRNDYGWGDEIDAELIAAELELVTAGVDAELDTVVREALVEYDAAMHELVHRSDVERYPLFSGTLRQNEGDTHRMRVEVSGWTVYYRINVNEFPRIRELQLEAGEFSRKRRKLIEDHIRGR